MIFKDEAGGFRILASLDRAMTAHLASVKSLESENQYQKDGHR